jgi:hypothetical protein
MTKAKVITMRKLNPDNSIKSGLSVNSMDELYRPDEEMTKDRVAILMVVLFAFFFGLLTGIVSTSVKADEGQSQHPNHVTNSETALLEQKKSWTPPVAKKITAPLPIDNDRIRQIKQEQGVEIQSLQMTASGYMMDFRFRVLDVEKAKKFFDHRVKPYLHVEKSNAKLPVPMASKVGAFRSTDRGKNIKPNKNYYIVFGNPDAHVKRGEKVTLVVGDFKIEGMTVN